MQINKRKIELNKEKEARRARTFTSKTKAPWLDFDHSPQSFFSQSNKEVISNLKTPRSRPEKALIRKLLTSKCFVKNSLFDSLFLVNLMFSLRIFYVF